ncbi:MAG TPA: hypothetical protein VF909_19065 [Roseiflexaceae bacterium]
MPNYIKRLGRLITPIWVLGALAACGGSAPIAAPVSAPTAAPIAAAAPTAASGEAPTAASNEAPTAASDEAPTVASNEVPTAASDEAPTVASNEAPTAASGEATGGKIVADLGFRPNTDGFNFENYGEAPGITNLTEADVRRLFGDQVCASQAGGNCILTPPAAAWMDATNKSMSGGHCYGFSVLSLALFSKKIQEADVGGTTTTALQLPGNQALQSAIAYSFSQQYLPSVREGAIGGTPNEVLDKLIALLQPGANEWYTIGFFKADGGGGHAVTPYAVEDRGDGKFAVMIYDNNWPGQARPIMFDRSSNSWYYDASINPGVPAERYEGNADTKSLLLFPMSPGLNKQPCPFCGASGSARYGGKLAAPVVEYNEILLDGEGHLLITDDQGRRTGYVGDTLVSEIPSVEIYRNMSADLWKDDEEPSYRVPVGMKFTLTIDGSQLKQASSPEVVMIGPGYDLGLTDIHLDPGDKDSLTFSPDGTHLSYKSASGESPNIFLGVETSGADYSFLAKGVDLEPGGTVNIGLDLQKGQLTLSSTGNKEDGVYALAVDRIDDAGEQVFGHDDISLGSNDTVYLDFLKWQGNGDSISLEVDRGSVGQIAETIELTDMDK